MEYHSAIKKKEILPFVTTCMDLEVRMLSEVKSGRKRQISYGIISASDTRFSDNGFKFTLSPEDVDTKVTFMCELIV